MPHLSLSKWLTIGCTVLALIAALVAIYAAQITMSDSLDTMAEDERLIAWWNTLAGTLNAVWTALLLVALAIDNFSRA